MLFVIQIYRGLADTDIQISNNIMTMHFKG